MKKSNQIYKIDLVLIIGTIICLIVLVGYARPLVIHPLNNFETTNSSVLFSFENANKILIDDSLDFTSPDEIYAEDNLLINLKPGVYYWRTEGILKSEIRRLTIQSEVNLKLKELENGSYELVNAGNVVLNVDVYNESLLQESFLLDADEGREVAGTKFIGQQNEE